MSVIVNHNSGFFSCCSIKLYKIIEYINTNKKLPLIVDSSQQFALYKNEHRDTTYDYFENYDIIDNINTDINIKYHWEDQFENYAQVDYKGIVPIIRKYFAPSKQIQDIIHVLEKKYCLDYDNICVLFYRGNDKITETKLPNYDDYIIHIQSILQTNPHIKFLIQSDETEFIEKMIMLFPENSFYFKDEIRHMKKCNSTVDFVFRESNYIFSKNYLAITIIMSKCKYIICGSGNCSIWIMLFRENCNNVYQFLNNELFIHKF